MTTQTDDGSPSPGLGVGLVVAAGLTAAAAAAYAYYNSPLVRGPSAADGARTETGAHSDADARTTDAPARGRAHAHAQDADADAAARGTRVAEPRKVRRRQKKGVAANEGAHADGDADGDKGTAKGQGHGHGQGKATGRSGGKGEGEVGPLLPKTAVAVAVPGAFEVAVESPDAVAGAAPHSPARATSKLGDGDKTEDKTDKRRKKKKKRAQQSKVRGRDGGDSGGEETEAGDGGVGDKARSKTGREATAATAHGALHAGDSTDTDTSPPVSAFTSTSIRAVGRGSLRASTRAPPLSEPHVQQQGARAPSQGARESRLLHLSFDTDSSWTHVDRLQRFAESPRPEDEDGRSGHPADAIDVTSSDLASTESSGSPVAERTIESIAGGGRGTRADLAPRTLAEKLVPKPDKTGVEDMLEQPDFPTLSRVTRVQPPRAHESAMLGFSSWEDSGDLGDESLLVPETDQEDEGEWDIVKSRNRTRPAQTATTITTITNTAASTPETMSKRQRQNARKREFVKSAKAEAETARQEGLERHKRELERLRIIEQAHRGGSGTGGGKRQPGGGMRAAVDDRGKLVWE